MTGNPRRILLVEDDPAHVELVGRALRESGDFSCAVARGVAEVREHLATAVPDLILSDFRLPDGDGRDVIELVCGRVPVVILTGRGDERAARDAFRAGALDYVTKSPESFAMLPRIVEWSLREWTNSRARKAAEDALGRQGEMLRTLLETVPIPIFYADASGVCLGSNKAFEDFVGLPRGAIFTGGSGSLSPWESEICGRGNEEIPVDSGMLEYEASIPRADGDVRSVLLRKASFPDARGGVAGIVGAIVDLTEKIETQRALERSRNSWRSLLEDFPTLIWRSDATGACDWFNRTWLAFTGRRLEEELGDGWIDGVHPEDRERCIAAYREAFDARRPVEMEYRLRHASGAYRWIRDIGKPCCEPDGEFAGYIGSCYDVTERVVYETALRTMLERNRVLLRELHHRTKNNMQVVGSLLAMQARSSGDARLAEMLRESQARIRTMALVQEELYRAPDLAHVRSGSFLRKLVEGFVGAYSNPGRSVRFTREIEDLDLSLDEAAPLGLVFNELVTNAFKHAFPSECSVESPEIRVRLLRGEGTLTAEVEDNGVGLSERFDVETSGTLGLQIVRTLARQLGGEFGCARRSDAGGALFRVRFPHADR